MNSERIQTVYKPVILIDPKEAKRVGIATEQPIFLSRDYRFVFDPGSIVEGRQLSKRKIEKIFAFPNLESAQDNYSGFIAVGEPVGTHVMQLITRRHSGLCIRTEKIHVTGIKAFVGKSEVKEGFVTEDVDPYTEESILKIDSMKQLDRGRTRYAFGVTQEGGVLFKKLTNDDLDVFDRMSKVFIKLYCRKLLGSIP